VPRFPAQQDEQEEPPYAAEHPVQPSASLQPDAVRQAQSPALQPSATKPQAFQELPESQPPD